MVAGQTMGSATCLRRCDRSRQGHKFGVRDRILPGFLQRAVNGGWREIPGLASEADTRALVVGSCEDSPDPYPVRFEGFWLLDAVAGNLRRKVQPTGEVAGAGGEDLCFLHILDARDLLERSLNRCLEGGKRNHTPVSRARLRMVGAPFPSRLVCMGWPFPQLGIGLSRKSRPTASTFIR